LHRARERVRKEMLKMMTPEEKAAVGVTEEAPWALRTVLLVEPETSLRTAIQAALMGAGYEVVVLPTGEAALDAAARRRGQLLILDKHCGAPNWVEVLTLLQVEEWSRENLPIVVLIDPPSGAETEVKAPRRDILLAWQAGAQ